MSKNAVILGEYKFPEGDASANRVLNIAHLLRELKWNVHIIGTGKLRTEDSSDNNSYFFKGYSYESINTQSGFILKRLINVVFRNLVAARIIWKRNKHNKIDLVLISVGYGRYLLPALLLAHLCNFRVVVDAIEWYDPSHIAMGRLGPVYWDVQLGLRWLFKKAGNIIAISTLLENYYAVSGCRVVRIPSIIDIQDPCWAIDPERWMPQGKVKIIYAGTPGKKDYLADVIRAIERIPDSQRKIELHIYGITVETMRTLLGEERNLLEQLYEKVFIHGRVPFGEVIDRLKEADFSILIRPQKRFANAGFPTKVPESLAAGTPVILNLTSDLGIYIRDGMEGLVIGDISPESIAQTLERAIALTPEDRENMRRNARNCAEKYFDYRVWLAGLEDFLENLQ